MTAEYWLPVVVVPVDGLAKNLRLTPTSADSSNIWGLLQGELYCDMDVFATTADTPPSAFRWFRLRFESGGEVVWIRADVCKVTVIGKPDIEARLAAVEERLTIIESQHME